MTTKKRLPDACDQVRRWDWPDLPAQDITLRDLLMWDREEKARLRARRQRRENWLRAFGYVLWLALAAMALLIADGLVALAAGR